MEDRELREIVFLLVTSLLLTTIIGSVGLGGLALKQVPLLFIGALTGIILYAGEKEHEPAKWIGAAIFGSVLIPLTNETIALNMLGVVAFLFATIIAILPILIKIRERIFNIAR